MKKSNKVHTVQDEIINAFNRNTSQTIVNFEPSKIPLKKSINFLIYFLAIIILFIIIGIIFVLINRFSKKKNNYQEIHYYHFFNYFIYLVPCILKKCAINAYCINKAFNAECRCNYGFNGNAKYYCDECGLTYYADNSENTRYI